MEALTGGSACTQLKSDSTLVSLLCFPDAQFAEVTKIKTRERILASLFQEYMTCDLLKPDYFATRFVVLVVDVLQKLCQSPNKNTSQII